MPGYHTRSSGARVSPDNQPSPLPAPADNNEAGTVQQTADQLQAVTDPVTGSVTESQCRFREDSVTNDPVMASFSQSLKDPKILMLRSEFNSAHKLCDEKYKEIQDKIKLIERAKLDTS